MINEDLIAENQKLKDELAIITTERDGLKKAMSLLKMDMEVLKAGAKEEEDEEDESSTEEAIEAPKSPGTGGSFRSSFRLPSFMMKPSGSKNDKLLNDADLENLDNLSMDSSSIGISSRKEPSVDSLSSPRNTPTGSRKRTSLLGRVFGKGNKKEQQQQQQHDTIHEFENEDEDLKTGELIVEWKRNEIKPVAPKSPKSGGGGGGGNRRSSLFKRIFGGGKGPEQEKIDESDSDSASSEEEVPMKMQPRRSSTRLQRLTADRRNKRESLRISKNFNLAEEHVDGLKSCLKHKQAPNTKQNVKFRESIIEVRRVSRIRGSAWDDCFFTEEELADFKYEAFMEECGLTDDDF